MKRSAPHVTIPVVTTVAIKLMAPEFAYHAMLDFQTVFPVRQITLEIAAPCSVFHPLPDISVTIQDR